MDATVEYETSSHLRPARVLFHGRTALPHDDWTTMFERLHEEAGQGSSVDILSDGKLIVVTPIGWFAGPELELLGRRLAVAGGITVIGRPRAKQ